MANTYYDSELTGEEIEQALEAIDGVIVPANNGKVLAVDNGKIVARSVQRGGGGSGGVSSVNSILPDGNGNVTLTADDIETDDNTSVQDEIDSAKNTLTQLDGRVDSTQSTEAYVLGASTAGVTISGTGVYVIYNNALYTTTQSIASTDTAPYTGKITPVSGGGLNSVQTNAQNFSRSMSGKIIASGNMGTAFAAIGYQFDSNRIVVFVPLPFIAQNLNYNVTVTSCTLLGVATVPTTDVTIDFKSNNFIRMMINRTGTVGTPFSAEFGLALDFG